MIRWFVTFLYGSTPIDFNSQFGMSESVERLKAATVRSIFLSLHKQSAVGTVTEHKVSLQRVIPLVSNSFKPLFIGRFEFKNGSVVLSGRFTMHWFVKAFMTIWLSFCVLWTAMASFAVATGRHSEELWFPLTGLGMIAFGVALVRSGKWFSRNDAKWLSQIIAAALSGVPPNQRFQPTQNASGVLRG